jgi:hypothetical protein
MKMDSEAMENSIGGVSNGTLDTIYKIKYATYLHGNCIFTLFCLNTNSVIYLHGTCIFSFEY